MSEESRTSEDNLSEEEKQPPKKRAKNIKPKQNTNKATLKRDEINVNEDGRTKKKSRGPKKRKKLDHPSTVDMITEALENLDDKNGSSVQAIKNYIINNYKVREDMIKSMIKRALSSALKDKLIVRPKNQAQKTQILSGRYMIRKVKLEEIEPPKPRPSKLRQLNVLKSTNKKAAKSKKKKKKRKGFY